MDESRKIRGMAVVDYRTSEVTVKELEGFGLKVIPTQPVDKLYEAVRGHADMQLHFANGKAVCAPEVYEYYKYHMPGCELIRGTAEIGAAYPQDIAYNTCFTGKYAICRRAYTAPEIISEYEYSHIPIIDTKQGYAKCSICVVNSDSVITADEGIHRLLTKLELNVLKISSGNIELHGMEGFIGGASGLIQPGLLAFNGDLRTHPDCDNITDFCRNTGVETISLNNGILTDIGSILRLS